jgi:hypothetical protein
MLARLKRDAPELAERVVRGEITAHEAAVQAGFRQHMVQHPATLEGYLASIQKYLSERERAALKERLYFGYSAVMQSSYMITRAGCAPGPLKKGFIRAQWTREARKDFGLPI